MSTGTTDWPAETAGLRRLLLLTLPLAAVFAVGMLVAWMNTGDPSTGVAGFADAIACVMGLLAWRLGSRGHLTATISIMIGTILAMSIIVALVPPPTPGLAALPLVGSAVALQYVGGRVLRRIIVACWLTSTIVMLEVQTLPVTAANPWTVLMNVLSLSAIIGVAMILLAQFADRLRDSVTSTEGAREALAESEARHRSVVEELDEVIFRTDTAGRLTLLNPAWSLITGRSVGSSLGEPLFASIDAEDRVSIRAQTDELLSGATDRFTASARLRTAEGIVRWVELRARPAIDGTGRVTGISGTMTDVTERRRLQGELTAMALHDPLTGLANRTLFRDRIESARMRGRRGPNISAVLFADLDGFKTVNDSVGHAAGDRLLIETAERFKLVLRPADTIARLGGDEFGILLEGVAGYAEAADVAERLVAAAREPVTVDGRRFVSSASIGIALMDRATTGADEVLRNADMAMYEAKATNRGGYTTFEPAMHRAAMARVDDLEQLRSAVERDEFYLDYQPIVELATEKLTGVEALLRWRHPSRGIVSPAAFIPLAEESGLIVPIGAWVIREACRQARAWFDAIPTCPSFSMGVNLSAVQLNDPRLHAEIAAAIAVSGVPPAALLFELTETAVMADPERAAAAMAVVKSLGVRLAIDDFGTGYSSLSYVRKFPVDVLKLDRSFISGLERDQSAIATAEVFVRLGRLLGLITVAEGVETIAEADTLRELGCDMAQGFHFGRPTTPAAIQALLEEAASAAAVAAAAKPTRRPVKRVPPAPLVPTR